VHIVEIAGDKMISADEGQFKEIIGESVKSNHFDIRRKYQQI
jgi:hypothetical protein